MSTALVTGALGKDPHSFANFEDVSVSHMAMDFEIDFERKIFFGSNTLTFKVLKDGVKEAVLDTRALLIRDAKSLTSSIPIEYSQPREHEVLGKSLHITFAAPLSKNTEVKVKIDYETTSASGGIQWLDPEQTAGKKHPYVFTQYQAIQARTGIPCMDTPSSKCPFSANVTVPAPLVALASGQPVVDAEGNPIVKKSADGKKLTYSFNQPLPVPCYLLAVVAGALKGAKIGPRSEIFAEPELLPSAVHEFGQDVEGFIQCAEKLTGIPYIWNTYNMVILPHSYAYGGMENVCLTFVSASLLVGDRSLVDVVAHEIAHSWSGNDATNATWTDFWLNEGFTMYFERLILGLTVDEEYRKFQILLGYKELEKTIEFMANDPPSWTSLQPNTIDQDPDEAFSIIPYEKGCLFVFYLETIVGGREEMCKWLHELYTQYQFKSFTTEDLKTSFLSFFSKPPYDLATKLEKIDWNTWINGSGLPPFDPTPALRTSLSDTCIELVQKWIAAADDPSAIEASPEDISKFKPAQIMYFLEELLTSPTKLSAATVSKMEDTYQLFNSKNPEIASRILVIALKSKVESAVPYAEAFVALHGRGRYAKTVYAAFVQYNLDKTVSVYKKHRMIYQAVVRNALDKMILQ